VFSLGLSFLFSIPLGLTGWVCAARAPQDVRPGQRKAAKVLSIIAVALSVAAAIAWLALMAAGYSPEDLQRSLQEELDRQRQSS
jgi:thiosulfate reductase cytochrome b subunit